MLVEVRVFGSDNSVLEIRRDLAQGYESVSLVIRLVSNPSLQAALHVHRGRRWVDPFGSYKDQYSKQPKKRQSNGNPSNH
jgi:hypothetical protein